MLNAPKKLVMNTKLVDSLVQLISSLSKEERSLLEQKLFFDSPEPTARELTQLAQVGRAFDFLEHEPDLYMLEDVEPIECC